MTAAEFGQLILVHIKKFVAVYRYRTLRGFIQPTQHMQ
jgi:hypothetical protein